MKKIPLFEGKLLGPDGQVWTLDQIKNMGRNERDTLYNQCTTSPEDQKKYSKLIDALGMEGDKNVILVSRKKYEILKTLVDGAWDDFDDKTCVRVTKIDDNGDLHAELSADSDFYKPRKVIFRKNLPHGSH